MHKEDFEGWHTLKQKLYEKSSYNGAYYFFRFPTLLQEHKSGGVANAKFTLFIPHFLPFVKGPVAQPHYELGVQH